MCSSVTMSARVDEIHLDIVTEKAARLHVIDLEITSSCIEW